MARTVTDWISLVRADAYFATVPEHRDDDAAVDDVAITLSVGRAGNATAPIGTLVLMTAWPASLGGRVQSLVEDYLGAPRITENASPPAVTADPEYEIGDRI